MLSWINKYYGPFDPSCLNQQEYNDKHPGDPAYTSKHLLFSPEEFDYDLRVNLYNLFENTVDPFLQLLRTQNLKEPIRTTDL